MRAQTARVRHNLIVSIRRSQSEIFGSLFMDCTEDWLVILLTWSLRVFTYIVFAISSDSPLPSMLPCTYFSFSSTTIGDAFLTIYIIMFFLYFDKHIFTKWNQKKNMAQKGKTDFIARRRKISFKGEYRYRSIGKTEFIQRGRKISSVAVTAKTSVFFSVSFAGFSLTVFPDVPPADLSQVRALSFWWR